MSLAESEALDEILLRTDGDRDFARQVREIARAESCASVYEELGHRGLLFPRLHAASTPEMQRVRTALVTRELVLAGHPEVPHLVTDIALQALRDGARAADNKMEPLVGLLASGRRSAVLLWTEPQGSGTLAELTTRASLDADGWRLSGSKAFSRFVDTASAAIVVAVDDRSGVGLYLLELDQPGVRLERLEGVRGGPYYHFTLCEARAHPLTADDLEARGRLAELVALERSGIDYLSQLERAIAVHSGSVEAIQTMVLLAHLVRVNLHAWQGDSETAATKWFVTECARERLLRLAEDIRPSKHDDALELERLAAEMILSAGASEALLDGVASVILDDPRVLWRAWGAGPAHAIPAAFVDRSRGLAELGRGAPRVTAEHMARLLEDSMGDEAGRLTVVGEFALASSGAEDVDVAAFLDRISPSDAAVISCARAQRLLEVVVADDRARSMLQAHQVARHRMAQAAIRIAAIWSAYLGSLAYSVESLALGDDSRVWRVEDAMEDLRHLLGARGLLRDGPGAILTPCRVVGSELMA